MAFAINTQLPTVEFDHETSRIKACYH